MNLSKPTHFIASEGLKIKDGAFVKKGRQILPGIFSHLEGFAHFNDVSSLFIDSVQN